MFLVYHFCQLVFFLHPTLISHMILIFIFTAHNPFISLCFLILFAPYFLFLFLFQPPSLCFLLYHTFEILQLPSLEHYFLILIERTLPRHPVFSVSMSFSTSVSLSLPITYTLSLSLAHHTTPHHSKAKQYRTLSPPLMTK